MHQSIIPQLELLGYQVDYRPDIERNELKEELGRYQGLIVRSKTEIDHDLLRKAGDLRFVARAGAGVDNLDEQFIAKRGIHIINAPEGNRDSLGEHVTGMLLNILHRLSEAHLALRSNKWDRESFRGTELGGKTVGIIGCGNMGTAFAKRLRGFGCTVLGYDKYLTDHQSRDYHPVEIDTLFQRCDIVSLHVPLTQETRGFFDYSFFQRFEKTIIILNSARGEILPLGDLVQLLKDDKVTAAGLDVFEQEPLIQISNNQPDIYNYIIGNPRVLISPHVAGWSYESYRRINEVLVRKIKTLKAKGSLD
jgi:D-3-phosphoglycerate dehydrogenase